MRIRAAIRPCILDLDLLRKPGVRSGIIHRVNSVRAILFTIAQRLWPELDEMSEQRRLVSVGDVIIFLIFAPIALAGLVWLALATDWELIRENWPALFFSGGLLALFTWVRYFFIVEIRTDRYGSAEGSLASMLQWSVVFIFGASALWLTVLFILMTFLWDWRKARSKAAGWSLLRSLSLELSLGTVAYLAALVFYQRLGGAIPIPGLSVQVLVLALAALAFHFLLILIIWSPYMAYSTWAHLRLTRSTSVNPLIRFFTLAVCLPVLSLPFAILVAGLYVEEGLYINLFFIFGLLMVALLARQLSWTAEASRQQSRQLEKLELLGRAIINSPPDAATLSKLLEEHVPMMFPSGRVTIWTAAEGCLFKNPPEWEVDLQPIWTWVKDKAGAQSFLARNNLPWCQTSERHDPVVLSPIFSVDEGDPIGCVYIELRSLAQPWDLKALHTLYPAAQSLSASVASALHQVRVYAEMMAYQSALQELEFAGRIQASFLPNELPALDGWELAVTLLPARETSGDFFDFIPLADGKVGIIIADVADKGVGAALYMALSRTLVRTYAMEYQASPDIILFSTNERILQDARANLFVTIFYGILEPETGILTYCNAGHSTPFLFSRRDGGTIHALTPTGMPIGVDEDSTWTQATIQIEPGDVLLLYTDGIPDAQNQDGAFFNERRLIEVAQSRLEASAQEIQVALIEAVQDFAANTAQFDDITLLVLKRDLPAEAQPGGAQQDYYE